jgi:hypothetical protein
MSQTAAVTFDERVKNTQGITEALRSARQVLGLTGAKAMQPSDLGAVSTKDGVRALKIVYSFHPNLLQTSGIGAIPDLDQVTRTTVTSSDARPTKEPLALTAFFLRKVAYELHCESAKAHDRCYYPQLYKPYANEAERQQERMNELAFCVASIKVLHRNHNLLDDEAKVAALEGLQYLFQNLRDHRVDYTCAQKTNTEDGSLADTLASYGTTLSQQLVETLPDNARKLGDFLINPAFLASLFPALPSFSAPHWEPEGLHTEITTMSGNNS